MDKRKRFIITTCVLLMLCLSVIGIINIKKDNGDTRDYSVADGGSSYTVKINLNGASNVDSKTIRCKIEGNGCYITLPGATRKDGTVLGYSNNKNDRKAKYDLSSMIFVSDNVELYVISYSENNLSIAANNLDFIETDKLSCKAYNTSKSCKIKLPRYNKIGYENKGYSTSKESLTGFIYAGDEYEIFKDTIMYPIYSTSSRHRIINVNKVLEYNGSFVEIENGCEESIYNNLLSYLNAIKVYTPYMLLGNKISFLIDDTFDEIWGSRYVGMNYGPKSLRSVDIRCSQTVYNDYYATMVHEMAHSWDFYYAKRLGENISSQSDVINLYNKYKNQQNRIFREYSFSNLYEFTADMMRYYYFKEYVPRTPYKNLDYPNDIKTSLEKYICISVNDYIEGKCH